MLQVCAVDFTAFYFLRPLMRGCRDAGWDVEFACADGPFAARLRAEGFHHRPIPISRSVSPLNIAAIALLAASLRTRPVDVVHTHTPIGGVVGRAAAVIGGARRVVHTFHGLPFPERPRTPSERSYLRLDRLLSRATTWSFSQAAGDAERAVAFGIARRDRLTVIGNGVDLRRFRPDADDRVVMRRELGIARDDTVIVTVLRLVREKGILELADAAAGLRQDPPPHVLVVGDALPSDRTSVVGELRAHPVARSVAVHWRLLGHRDDVDRVLRAADVFALPSHREGLPRSVIEALATGLPVVATDIPACRELVDESVGRLVPVGDSATLRDALRSLMEDRAGRQLIGVRARERAVARYDEERIVATQLTVLRSLVA